MTNQPAPTENDDEPPTLQKPTLLQVFGSVVSAIFGVQSNKNRERDFAKGDPKQFAIVYITIVVAIVLTMITVVQIVLRSTGGS